MESLQLQAVLARAEEEYKPLNIGTKDSRPLKKNEIIILVALSSLLKRKEGK
ncbi:MAG: hypothetical protein KGI54_14720 [Pseudomonadota bacterium]|nr:hypothetical protein [Pseudomonadota bacterium]